MPSDDRVVANLKPMHLLSLQREKLTTHDRRKMKGTLS